MAPGNKERHPGHTGTIPKTKVRNNCNVPQEAVTPTRRDMASNLVTTSLDWVPVSEYNARSNCNQSRKQTNNTSDQELTDLDNSVSFESGFGRFVPVRPQPRALPLTVQNRESLTTDNHDDGASSTSHTLHPYAHQMQNGMIPHSNHAAAAVMIVNPTTPNAVAGNMSQTFNAPNQNRNNLTRNLNSTRNTFEGSNTNNNNASPVTNSRSGTKSVNLMNNMYDPGQSSFNNINENNQAHRESARALGEAIVAACPDAAAVERRLGQIREYIRVTSSLVDTMRNSEDEQDVVVRPVSVQSNGSTFSDNDLWQNEIKNKMEMSQIRLTALKQQQKRLLKYQAEAKEQLEEINKERQTQEIHHPSTSHENINAMPNLTLSANYHHPNRMYGANQIGVATTLPQSADALSAQMSGADNDHSHDDRFSIREGNNASSEEAAGGGRDSEVDDDDVMLSERERILQLKLRELQMKKQHMENLVTEFQKLQMATRLGSSHNTYSSSGEDSGDDEPSRKCNKTGVNLKNEDPFKIMEIKAIKTALQKTKDLMRSVETFEGNHLSGAHEENFHIPNHSNIHDNKSEGGGSMGGWSNEGSVCRVRNSLPQRHKFTNEQHSQQLQHLQPQQQNLQPPQHQQHLQPLQHQQHLQQPQHQQHLQQPQHQQHLQQPQHQQHLQQPQHQQFLQPPQHMQPLQHQQPMQQSQHQQHSQSSQHMQHPQHQQQLQHQPHTQQNHEANINSLQELAQELRMETEKIMGERARIKDVVTNKERKQKKVNEAGPAERRQMQLRALLADKQRELEALLNKEVMTNDTEVQNMKPNSRVASVVNESYNSEQEEPESRSEHIQMDSQSSRDNENFRGGDSAATAASHRGSAYGSDSDSASRNKSNQRNRQRRRPTLDRQSEESNVLPLSNNNNSNMRHEARVESTNVNMVPPVAQNNENTGHIPYSHLPPTCWNTTKSNQDMRTNQFTQNSHSQTMDRLMGTPMSFPPSMPYNMMMPYGMVGGCGCGCGFWGAWCWQQLVLQQREIHQLREQLSHLEERWRAETASHTLNNQVPPGNRANNYWDNFRSYSRQNLLSANSKSNAETQAGAHAAPLAERSHNSLHHTSSSTSPSLTPKRNTEAPAAPRRNLPYERSLSFSSAPDVLNVNQNAEPDAPRQPDDAAHVNVNRRNLNYADPIPEIVQSHSNNLSSPSDSKRKSSAKLPSRNSTSRRNYGLDVSPANNVNVASASAEVPNPNLASASREVRDKATSKLFDLLRENIYSEVTTLIGVNESHPDFLIQLFRELQLISSDPLRQRVLQSIRNVLSQYSSLIENRNEDTDRTESANATVTTTSAEASDCHDCNGQNMCSSTVQIDNKIVRFLLLKSEEIFTSELLESLASIILCSSTENRQMKRLLDLLSKYEGMRVCDVSSDIIENLPLFSSVGNEGDESNHLTSEISESSILQDVAGSLNLFSSSESQLHQMNACPYDMWPAHVHMDIDGNDNSPRSSQEGKVDLINCSEMHNGDLAEADQTCHAEAGDGGANAHDDMIGNAEALPDVVDTEEVTPTEAEAEWLGLDRVPTRLHMEESSEKQKGDI
ncbi:putative mediator of RNA polymerase II transcription subunit 26 isoform X4 [Nymphalis io]|uniref:putative mediator of RNA polymerase II transcription subunit 26 isoform X4 n=1 Tax=Inachis io TaxID=171585 RepID=UPI00216A403A|nr:putative mediator of RNA polymerase II transcription subunit 26 isoform X4 [Nymphalis io]